MTLLYSCTVTVLIGIIHLTASEQYMYGIACKNMRECTIRDIVDHAAKKFRHAGFSAGNAGQYARLWQEDGVTVHRSGAGRKEVQYLRYSKSRGGGKPRLGPRWACVIISCQGCWIWRAQCVIIYCQGCWIHGKRASCTPCTGAGKGPLCDTACQEGRQNHLVSW